MRGHARGCFVDRHLPRCPLSLHPRSGEQIPFLTVQIARASNPRGTTAMWVRDRLDGLWCDEDFADRYPHDGRPGLSPAQLATVCVLQVLLGLSDRQAAEAVRCRIDFKYALSMELDDPGFHHSVLADFRERLAEDGRADRLLDLALAPEGGRSGPRAHHAAYRLHPCPGRGPRPHRLELVTEAVRGTLEEVARTAGQLLVGLVDEEWGRRYGRPVRLGKNPTRPKTRILAADNDACQLLDLLDQDRSSYRSGPAAEALRQIVVQNYYRDAAGRLCWHRRGRRAAALSVSDRLALRHHGALRAPRAHHPLEGLRRPPHRNLRRRQHQRDHRGHHLGRTNDGQALPGIHTRLAHWSWWG